jgi:hypothetical protein
MTARTHAADWFRDLKQVSQGNPKWLSRAGEFVSRPCTHRSGQIGCILDAGNVVRVT